jgi:hypothetical protein
VHCHATEFGCGNLCGLGDQTEIDSTRIPELRLIQEANLSTTGEASTGEPDPPGCANQAAASGALGSSAPIRTTAEKTSGKYGVAAKEGRVLTARRRKVLVR